MADKEQKSIQTYEDDAARSLAEVCASTPFTLKDLDEAEKIMSSFTYAFTAPPPTKEAMDGLMERTLEWAKGSGFKPARDPDGKIPMLVPESYTQEMVQTLESQGFRVIRQPLMPYG